jgi:hypothetical protein
MQTTNQFISEGKTSIGEFEITPQNPHFLNERVSEVSVEMTCEIVQEIISTEWLRYKSSNNSFSNSNPPSLVEEENESEYINIINRLRHLLYTLDDRIKYSETELLKAQILLIRFYNWNIGLPIFRNYVDLFFIVVVCLLVAHKLSADCPFSNYVWSSEELSNVDFQTLNDCEVYFLTKMNYDVWICDEEYEEKNKALLKNKTIAETTVFTE